MPTFVSSWFMDILSDGAPEVQKSPSWHSAKDGLTIIPWCWIIGLSSAIRLSALRADPWFCVIRLPWCCSYRRVARRFPPAV